MCPYENLDVWKKSADFTIDVYKCTESFPRDERFGLTQARYGEPQYRAQQILPKVPDGNHRKSSLNFLSMAQGSASEIATEMLIAFRLGFLPEEDFKISWERLDGIGRMITGLCNHLRDKLH